MNRISDKDIVIRKPRKCFGCLRWMNKGDLGQTQTNVDDGRIYSITICEDCEVIVRKMGHDEFGEGELREESPHPAPEAEDAEIFPKKKLDK